ncbi:BON domain-containing protein [Glaciecola sp. KUL10]|uniref:BON domain-containing protein n=1 Tax=Glaciecola sp. (strain KUL10) TaxID=2161813 RepID=UPI000D7884C2|nr:BON domain-containing protein [Glaciecola sp. KUL10]GBL06081.1 transport-associated protein [Glaciecola sp. KUL10]
MIKKICLASIITLSLVVQTGCAVVAVGAAGTAAAVSANDRRTVGTQIDDKTTQSRVRSAINAHIEIKEEAAISVDVYNGQVLLTGQAPTQEMISKAQAAAQSVENVIKVHNQIRLGTPIPATSTMNDVWLASKLKTQMLASDRVPMLKLDLTVEDSEVFIMGLLTKEEATAAVEVARNVKGVTKVIRVMELAN